MKVIAPPINLIAHRGICLYRVPENTIPGLREALEKGFLIETDLQKIKDANVLFHDKFIPGPNDTDINGGGFYLPSGKKPITECTLDELRLKAKFDKTKLETLLTEQAGESVHLEINEEPHIATLDEFLSLLKQFPSSKAFLEIKRPELNTTYNDGLEKELIGMVSDLDLINNIIINTSSLSTLENIRKVSSDIEISIDTDFIDGIESAHNLNEAKRLEEELKLNYWNPPFGEVHKELLEDIEKIGLNIATWINHATKQREFEEIKRLISIGVKYIFTDQAEEVKRLLVVKS